MKTATKLARPADVTSTRLTPTVVGSEAEAMDLAVEGTRRRPILAINDEGQLVVCCRSTARTKGWEVQGALYHRINNGTRTPKVDAAPDSNPKRRATDVDGVVVMSAKKVAKAQAAISDAAATLGLDDLLK